MRKRPFYRTPAFRMELGLPEAEDVLAFIIQIHSDDLLTCSARGEWSRNKHNWLLK